MTDEQPRLFQIWLDASDGSIATYDGVQWPDGTADVHHRHRCPDGIQWSPESLAETIHGKLARIEWAPDVEAQRDGAYRERAQLLALLAQHYPAVLAPASVEDTGEDGWEILYLDLPTGQASWHIHPRDLPLFATVQSVAPGEAEWDGHSTEEKYERIAKLVGELAEADRYAAMVNAPLRPETIAAINERIRSGDMPVRKVRLGQTMTPEQLACGATEGIDTAGCDCGHDGMGVSWHRDWCAWRKEQP